MKVSLNWLKDYLTISHDPEKIGEILTEIGLEVEGMEEVESIPGGLEGLVIGKVTHCEQHPNADRLSLTKVDVGGEEELQIVCGAPNVAAGQKVVVATVGTELHPTEGDSFKIKKGKIRGEVSEGMICAEDEIGLGTDHDGIIVLPETAEVGTLASDFFQIEKDYVYEIGLTPNRSDATSHLGVARDLAAALKINYEGDGNVKTPGVTDFQVDNTDEAIEVIVENEEACPRYAGLVITDVEVKESPDWLKNRLRSIDVRPINNLVDITNFILHEWGQPLHAFDLDKIKGRTVRVKTLAEGTSFESLDEQKRTLKAGDLMICNGDSEGMCIAGVFGGIGSGVTESTKAIFLESAHFASQWVRRTSMHHNLRTDAAKVFEKGSDPSIVVDALKRAALLIKELAGGTISSEIIDLYPKPIQPVEVDVSYAYVNRLIGVNMEHSDIRAILDAMHMDVLEEDDTHFKVAIPTDKSDVTRPADVVEEVLRIYGLNKVPMSDQIRSSVSYSDYPNRRDAQNKISDYLSGNGFHEMMAVSLTESRYFKDILPLEESSLVYINNTSNVQLDVMRPSMLFSGLEAVARNQNRQQQDVKVYEFGKTYRALEEGYEENHHLSVFLSGQRQPESWLNKDAKAVDYYSLRAFVQQILERMGIGGFQVTALESDPVFLYGLRYHRGPKTLVEFGQVDKTLLKKMDIRQPVYYADFNWDALVATLKKHRIEFEELTKYPSVRRDLALVVDNSVKFSDIVAIARKAGKKLLKDINLFDVYSNAEQLGADKKSYAVSYLFEDPSKTLKIKEVDKVMDKLIQDYEQKIGATIRR